MSDLVKLIGAAAGGALLGIAMPALAELLRSWVRRGAKEAAATPDTEDDRRWALWGAPLLRVAELLDKGQHAEASKVLAAILAERKNP